MFYLIFKILLESMIEMMNCSRNLCRHVCKGKIKLEDNSFTDKSKRINCGNIKKE